MRVLSKRNFWVLGILLLIPMLLAAVLLFYTPPALAPYHTNVPLISGAFVLGLLDGAALALLGVTINGSHNILPPRRTAIFYFVTGLFMLFVVLLPSIVQILSASYARPGRHFLPSIFFIYACFGTFTLIFGLLTLLRYRKLKTAS